MVKFLVKQKHINLEQHNNIGRTPIFEAVRCQCHSKIEILKHLIEECNVNYMHANINGYSLLRHAISRGYTDAVKYLLELGAQNEILPEGASDYAS